MLAKDIVYISLQSIYQVLTLFEPGYIYYLFESGGELSHTLKNLKNAYVPIKLTKME